MRKKKGKFRSNLQVTMRTSEIRWTINQIPKENENPEKGMFYRQMERDWSDWIKVREKKFEIN